MGVGVIVVTTDDTGGTVVALVLITFGIIQKDMSLPRVASKPPVFFSGMSIMVIRSFVALLLVKTTVPVPLAEMRGSKATLSHFGVEDTDPTVKSTEIFSLQEIRRFAPADFSVAQENEIGFPSSIRSVVVETLNVVVMGSGMTLLSTETVIDFVWMPL